MADALVTAPGVADQAALEPRAVHSAAASTGPASVARDLIDGLSRRTVWQTFAWDEIQQRYNRSVLGIFWIAGSFGVFVASIAVFFGGFATLGTSTFVAYVTVGFAAFTFLTGNLTDGCAVFRSSAGWIQSSPLPYSIYVYKSVARSAFTFALQLGFGLFILLAFFGWRPGPLSLLAVPVIGLYLLNAVWIQYALGLLAARWGDVEHVVATAQRVLFFTTPILWVYEERSGTVRRLADLNPLTHFVQLLRAPLLGDAPGAGSVLFVVAFTAAGWALTLLAAGRMRRRLPFWL